MFEIKDDHLACGALLTAALSHVQGIRRVSQLNDLTELDSVQHTPSLFVMYYGDTLNDTANAGSLMQLKQTWLVVLVDRKGSTTTGQNIAATIRALSGKKTADAGPWLRVNTPIKPKYTQGFAYYPLAFTCQMRLRGN